MQPHLAAYAHSRDVEPPLKRAKHDDRSHGKYGEIGLMRKEGLHESFLGSSSGIYFARSVYNALQSETPQADIVPGEDDRLAVKADFWASSEASDAESVTFEQLKDLSDEYFDHWHPTFPFLFATSVLQSFDKIAKSPLHRLEQVIDNVDLTIVRAIMSISAADRRQCGSARRKQVPRKLLFCSYTHAIESIQSHLSRPVCLRSLQSVIAVQLFLTSMLRHNAAMRLSGLAVRTVFHLGLHRCPARYATFTHDDIQLRRRIFWTTYCLDRMLCQSLGLPLGIRDDDIDVCLFDWEKHGHDLLPSMILDPRLASLHFLAKHAEIKGMIVELCNKNIDKRPVDAQARHNVEEAMARWHNEMDSFLDLNPGDTIFNRGRKAALEAIRTECIIALNRPLLALPKDTSDYKRALQTCINAARSIIGALHAKLLAHLAKIASRDAAKGLAPLFWPSFTWMIWMSAFIILYAAAENELRLDVAKQLIQKSIEVLEHLSSRNTYWPSACAVAIKELSSQLDGASQGRRIKSYGTVSQLNSPLQFDPSCVDLGTWPMDALINTNDVALFDGFDIPFWLGDDQYSSVTDLWNTDQQ